jgi:hypothetical protein
MESSDTGTPLLGPEYLYQKESYEFFLDFNNKARSQYSQINLTQKYLSQNLIKAVKYNYTTDPKV